MKINEITNELEKIAPISLQEPYDNCGLIVGDANREATGALLCIDVDEDIIDEAKKRNCNLIISHHPLIFKGIKRVTGKTHIERCVAKAIKNDIAIYAAHTNFDNITSGVSFKIAEKLGLSDLKILSPKQDTLFKIITFVPHDYVDKVQKACFERGAGHIGNYDSCSFSSVGEGSFRALAGANPFVGKLSEQHIEKECRIEVISQANNINAVVASIKKAHPYEEPAIDIYPLKNISQTYGFGVVGEIQDEKEEREFLQQIKEIFNVKMIKHSPFLNKKIKKVALCGGSGADFISNAIACKADIYITGDIGYHRFFEAENKILLADIGHFESEQYTKEIFYEKIIKKFPNFAVQFSEVEKNIVSYF